MSLILDAINRADQERSESNYSPNLQTSQSPQPKPTPPYARWAIEALLVVIVIGVFANQWFFKLQAGDAVTSETDSSLAQKNQLTTNKQNKALAQSENLALTEPQFSNFETPTNNSTTPATTPTPPESPQIQPLTAIQPKDQSPISALYNQAQTAPKKDSLAASASKQVVTDQPTTLTPATPLTTSDSTPLLTDLSWRVQQKIPSLDYTQHNYSQYPGESTVELNQQLLKPGEQVTLGLRLVSIDSEFITLNYQGTKFKLWALNSWVNFN